MENVIVLKQATTLIDDFKVVQRGNMVESINNLNRVFHYIDLSYVGQGIIFHGWVGFRTADQMKLLLEGHFMDFYKKYRCKCALVESSKMSGSFSDTNDWLSKIYMPKLVALGLTKVAVVLPLNLFAQMAVDEWDKNVGGFSSRNFGSVADAIGWLKS